MDPLLLVVVSHFAMKSPWAFARPPGPPGGIGISSTLAKPLIPPSAFDRIFTQDEIEEELQDQLIRKIQSMYRAKRARALMKQLIKANYVKEYDEDTGYFFYRNKRTGEVQYTKPVALGPDDLDDPKIYIAPPDYEHDESVVRYFGLVITNQKFDAKKIPDLDTCVLEDHKQISEILSHPYMCKFREDDCIFLKNPSMSALVNTMDSMEGKISRAIEELRQDEPTEQGSLAGMSVGVDNAEEGPDNNNDDMSLGDQSAATETAASVTSKNSAHSKVSALTKHSAFSSKFGGTKSNMSSKKNAESRKRAGSPKSRRTGSFIGESSMDDLSLAGEVERDNDFEEYDTKRDIPAQRQKISKLLEQQPPENQVAFFIFYCTHVISIKKSGPSDGMYFLCSDTSWASSKKVRKSALPLVQFTAMLRKIPCKSKTVCLDVVHSQKPKDTLFRTRVMYPQPDIYDKVANLGDAVCIGSCMSGLTGAAAARYMKNNEVEEAQDLKMKQMEEEAQKAEGRVDKKLDATRRDIEEARGAALLLWDAAS